MMTRQEIYNTVKNHLLTQKEKSYNVNNKFCFYRHPTKNLKCAIGCLISDERYKPDYDNWGDTVAVLTDVNIFDIDDFPFLMDLQRIHDYYNVGDWENRLVYFASQYNLIP